MRALWRTVERLTPEFESTADKGNLAQASERRHARGVWGPVLMLARCEEVFFTFGSKPGA